MGRRDTFILSVLSCWEMPAVAGRWGDTDSVYSPNQVFHEAESSDCRWQTCWLRCSPVSNCPEPSHSWLPMVISPQSSVFLGYSFSPRVTSALITAVFALQSISTVVTSGPTFVISKNLSRIVLIVLAKQRATVLPPQRRHAVSSTSSLETCHQEVNCSPPLSQSLQP